MTEKQIHAYVITWFRTKMPQKYNANENYFQYIVLGQLDFSTLTQLGYLINFNISHMTSNIYDYSLVHSAELSTARSHCLMGIPPMTQPWPNQNPSPFLFLTYSCGSYLWVVQSIISNLTFWENVYLAFDSYFLSWNNYILSVK